MADLLLPLPGFKRCNKCGELKAVEEFHFRSDQWHPDGTRRRKQPCKLCYNEATSQHRSDHPEVQQAWCEANRPRLRQQAKANYKRRRGTLRGWLKSNLTTRRQQCRTDGTEFTITVDDVLRLYESQEGLCALSGSELKWGVDSNRGPDTLSVDRIEATGGYVVGNVRLVTHWANVARQRLNDEEFIERCAEVFGFAVGKTADELLCWFGLRPLVESDENT